MNTRDSNINLKKAVIFARQSDSRSVDSQFIELRSYCQNSNLEVVDQIEGKINLSLIDFSEATVILGTELNFDQDFRYVDEDNLNFLIPNQEQWQNVFFCGLNWSYQLFSK